MKRKCSTCAYYVMKWCAIFNEDKFSWGSCSNHQLPEEVEAEVIDDRVVAYIESRDW
jgi:non-canonical (house-cleaning) NTP pyrophosphatase